MVVSQTNYDKLAAVDMGIGWEIHDGDLREKPPMSFRHGHTTLYLGAQLVQQLDPTEYMARAGHGHVSRGDVTYYIPDVFVFPTSMIGPGADRPDVMEVYADPLPLVVEVWSPSTGGYDVNEKIPEYKRRGDLEIWRVHPFERTVTSWRRQPDGSYIETIYQGGTVRPTALPNVTIDLDALFGAPWASQTDR